MAEFVAMQYLSDMTDADLMQRPHPDCNHVNYQLGHLITSEHQMMAGVAPQQMPQLPAGFAEKYIKQKAASDDPADFASKAELLETYRQQREATLAVLAETTEQMLDRPTGVEYAPTLGAMLRLQGEHWLMHCGQWVVVRRITGKPLVM